MTDDKFYIASQMHEGIDFQTWRENTAVDDIRRFLKYKSLMQDKVILDFGCGNGKFLELSKEQSNSKQTIGIELDKEAVKCLKDVGLECYESTEELPEVNFDLVFMFHVIEHLSEPEMVLESLFRHVAKNGRIIIETPNADDALLSIYNCEKFADFTYWSPHIYLYNEDTLTKMLENAGFTIIEREQEQRYPLANHLRWLAKGLPGGGIKEFQELNDQKLNRAYAEVLKELKACDTLVFTIIRE
jgi:2-polyprenyl-3-methyl-5-hydroxy-6-metoxy-1,4-benzoquinol methylase